MKVKLAAQLLNQSVADALTFYKDTLQLETYKGSAATIKFLKKINDLFDIFNSKSIHQSIYGYSRFKYWTHEQKDGLISYIPQKKLDLSAS